MAPRTSRCKRSRRRAAGGRARRRVAWSWDHRPLLIVRATRTAKTGGGRSGHHRGGACFAALSGSLPEVATTPDVASLFAGLDFQDRLRQKFIHRLANLLIGFLDALGIQILTDLAKDVVLARLFEVGHHDLLGIGVGFRAGESEFGCRPQAEQPVTPRVRLELEFFVDGKLLLETFLAFVERGHACLAVSGAAGRSRLQLLVRTVWPERMLHQL